jgi:hypothetical protein
VDASERLSQLNLTEIQQREIVRVLLHCCGNVSPQLGFRLIPAHVLMTMCRRKPTTHITLSLLSIYARTRMHTRLRSSSAYGTSSGTWAKRASVEPRSSRISKGAGRESLGMGRRSLSAECEMWRDCMRGLSRRAGSRSRFSKSVRSKFSHVFRADGGNRAAGGLHDSQVSSNALLC